MVDTLTPKQRHHVMAAIQQRNTKPEMIVRKAVHGLGFRYRLHQSRLPGSPDLAFARLGKVIFVHGCFWHRHDCCRNGQATPASNRAYWLAKFRRNTARDRRSLKALKTDGWKALVLWECEVRAWSQTKLQSRLKRFLGTGSDRSRTK